MTQLVRSKATWLYLMRKWQATWAPVAFIALGFLCAWTVVIPIWVVWVLFQMRVQGLNRRAERPAP